jgi:uncharacterized protein
MKKIIVTLSLICFSTSFLKAQELINKIEVTGQAEIEVEPDYFEYTINLQEYYKSENEKVSIETLEKSLIKAVGEIGIKKVNLTINSVQGNRRYSSDNKPMNFLESRNYILKIKSINDINNLLPKLDKLGLTGTSLSKMTNKMQANFEKELRIKAVNDAKEKAESIAESVGKKIGDIILISTNEFNGFRKGWKSYDFNEETVSLGYGSFKTDIEVEKIKMSYQVHITFQMK